MAINDKCSEFANYDKGTVGHTLFVGYTKAKDEISAMMSSYTNTSDEN